MTPEQLDKLDQELAIQVMGWQLGNQFYHTKGEVTRTFDSVWVGHWRPTRSWREAGEALDYALTQKRFRVCLYAYPEGFTSWINNNSGEGDCDTAPNCGPLAICLAIAKAWNIEAKK